ncbi:single-strand DNA-binding protein [Sphingobium sp. B1D7B]|nr:single-strand DNA-binding protein [Sphingobium sp. B1D7B]
MAVTDKWTDRTSGEKKERTEWIPVVIRSDGLIGVAERYLRKGKRVFIQGEWRTRRWQDQNGQDRYSTEIVLQGFDAKLVMLDGAEGAGSGNAQSRQQSGYNTRGQADNLDDDSGIPF